MTWLSKSGKPHANKVPIEERFWKKVDIKGENECWHWLGRSNQPYGYTGILPYGVVRFQGNITMAHRVSFMLKKGPIPEGHIIRHTCDNPKCVNPNHLISGTYKENSQDAIQRGRFNVRRGEKVNTAKLNEHQVRLLRKKFQEKKLSALEISLLMGMRLVSVYRMLQGHSWKHIT